MAIQVFISYRREGGDFTALNMYQALRERGYDVFYDVESLRSGKFSKKLLEKIKECTDFVLVLPPRALDRCVNEGDWVRLEVECAIENNKNIIPIMLRGFSWPTDLPETMKDLPDYNGIPASAEDFEYVIDRLEKKFLKSSIKSEYEEKERQQIIKISDNLSVVEKALDEGRFDWVIEQLGNPETTPEFSRLSPQEKGKLYKYLLWAERGMRWSDDPHKALAEPFYGPNYYGACKYGDKAEMERINNSLLRNIHSFIDMNVDLNNKIAYQIDDPAQCGGDFCYLWECILFLTKNLAFEFMTKRDFEGRRYTYGLPDETEEKIKTVVRLIDEFKSICPKWIYNGKEGLANSHRFSCFCSAVSEYIDYSELRRKELRPYKRSLIIRNTQVLIVTALAILLQVISLMSSWDYSHSLPSNNALSLVCMGAYVIVILVWSVVWDWRLIRRIGRLGDSHYLDDFFVDDIGNIRVILLVLYALGIMIPVFGLVCRLLHNQFRIKGVMDNAMQWGIFVGYIIVNVLCVYFGTDCRRGIFFWDHFKFLLSKREIKSFKESAYQWREEKL